MPVIDDSAAFRLALASEGEAARIVALRAGRGLGRCLTEMGLNVGTDR